MKKATGTSEIDALFALPLSEFTAARNALAKKLKQEKRDDEAEQVKGLAKPSVSAWAVNQLYWRHPREFQRLRTAGDRLAKAQTSQLTRGDADLRGAMDERQNAVSSLLRVAEDLLLQHRHGATPETLHRIQTTLETLSTSSSVKDAPLAGRLSEDVAPLGFESLAALVPNVPLKLIKNAKAAEADHAEKERQAAMARVQDREKDLHEAEERMAKAKLAVEMAEGALEKAREELRKLESQEWSSTAQKHQT